MQIPVYKDSQCGSFIIHFPLVESWQPLQEMTQAFGPTYVINVERNPTVTSYEVRQLCKNVLKRTSRDLAKHNIHNMHHVMFWSAT